MRFRRERPARVPSSLDGEGKRVELFGGAGPVEIVLDEGAVAEAVEDDGGVDQGAEEGEAKGNCELERGRGRCVLVGREK